MSITPSRRARNEAIVQSLRASERSWRGGVSPPRGSERAPSQAGVVTPSRVDPGVFEIGLVEGMHAVVLHLRRAMVGQRQPVGLDDDAGILDDLLEVLHQLLARFRVGRRQRLLELGVEV